MKDYLKFCEIDLNDKVQFTSFEVSRSYFIYIIQILNLITPRVKIIPNLSNL